MKMIEWKRVDKSNPPEGSYLFIYDGTIFEGWTIGEEDDQGYPMWEGNESYSRKCYEVRWYAEINLPDPLYPT